MLYSFSVCPRLLTAQALVPRLGALRTRQARGFFDISLVSLKRTLANPLPKHACVSIDFMLLYHWPNDFRRFDVCRRMEVQQVVSVKLDPRIACGIEL